MTADSPPVLYPLDEFYRRAGRPFPAVEARGGDALPDGVRALLVHERDMTPTLQHHYGAELELDPLEITRQSDYLMRMVALRMPSRYPVEFGAIRIHLNGFPEAARPIILACRRPLGQILADFEIVHTTTPGGFFMLKADDLIGPALGQPLHTPLFGRTAHIRDGRNRPLVDVVEVLTPPIPKPLTRNAP